MGKEKPGFLTAKAISNRIKSKGLQRLRWYCQICQKQCRDENGFKCHITSESHHRQILLFNENSDSFLGEYTRHFMKGYLDILKRQFGGKRTNANLIYQEYIKDKQHIHMNATKFTTLTGFINCLHRMGICKVDNTEKGWFIEYIERNPEEVYQEKKKRKMEKLDEFDENNFFNLFQKNQSVDHFKTSDNLDPSTSEFKKSEDEVISLNFDKSRGQIEINNMWDRVDEQLFEKKVDLKNKCDEDVKMIRSTQDFKNADLESRKRKNDSEEKEKPIIDRPIKHLTVLDEIIKEDVRERERKSRRRYWLREGILVKLIDERLPKELKNCNAVVRQLQDKFTAIIKTVNVESGNRKMRVVQEHVMTVVPKVGGRVLVVNGAYHDSQATVLKIDKDNLEADLRIMSGLHTGLIVKRINFDDFSKLHESES